MGRGRAKAKQTKVARELKYNAPNTDLESLRAELTGTAARPAPKVEEPDPYKSYYDDEDEAAE